MLRQRNELIIGIVKAELEAFALIVKHLKSKNVTVIFNNNGGHDAAANAQQFIDMLGLDFPGWRRGSWICFSVLMVLNV